MTVSTTALVSVPFVQSSAVAVGAANTPKTSTMNWVELPKNSISLAVAGAWLVVTTPALEACTFAPAAYQLTSADVLTAPAGRTPTKPGAVVGLTIATLIASAPIVSSLPPTAAFGSQAAEPP